MNQSLGSYLNVCYVRLYFDIGAIAITPSHGYDSITPGNNHGGASMLTPSSENGGDSYPR
ncbi:hypothetical protein N7471_012410 [Penicillium samsonianum]|uniref:uncharacterized protein n=1 Tax=Penicillium samsonianum TaxID=1882272 RepID=UPI0025499489|nr:uncharacterized protein N7471_012410 [Penicillium samsonianum]KAJ6125093.1 hypothetical protein N7471_012410 [Penicillium samsonianum]